MKWTKTVSTLALTACVAATYAPAPANAGNYEVSSCNLAPEGANNSWTWSSNDAAEPPQYSQHSACPYEGGGHSSQADEEGGLSTTDALGLTSGAPPGTSANWTFRAPAGTTITALNYEPYLGHELDGFNDWSPALRADGTIVPGQTCLDSPENGETCSVGQPASAGTDLIELSGLTAHELSLGIVCQAPTGDECVTGATRHAVWAAMYGATVTINDPTPPTLNTPSGPLWGAGEAAQPHKGTESLTVAADDKGSGVASILLSADGRPLSTYTVPCNSTLAQPCPEATDPQTLSLATTRLSDGVHTLSLVATDAAGNQSTIASTEITVENDEGTQAAGPELPTNVGPGTGNAVPSIAKLQIAESLHRRELIVHVMMTAGTRGKVRISFTGRLNGRIVAEGTKVIVLAHGRGVAVYRLGARTAAHAILRVTARLDHEPAVTRTLERRRRLR